MRRLCIILIFLMLSFPVKLIGDEPPNYPPLRAAYPTPSIPLYEVNSKNWHVIKKPLDNKISKAHKKLHYEDFKTKKK